MEYNDLTLNISFSALLITFEKRKFEGEINTKFSIQIVHTGYASNFLPIELKLWVIVASHKIQMSESYKSIIPLGI